MSFTLLDAHRAIEPILGPPLNRAGVRANRLRHGIVALGIERVIGRRFVSPQIQHLGAPPVNGRRVGLVDDDAFRQVVEPTRQQFVVPRCVCEVPDHTDGPDDRRDQGEHGGPGCSQSGIEARCRRAPRDKYADHHPAVPCVEERPSRRVIAGAPIAVRQQPTRVGVPWRQSCCGGCCGGSVGVGSGCGGGTSLGGWPRGHGRVSPGTWLVVRHTRFSNGAPCLVISDEENGRLKFLLQPSTFVFHEITTNDRNEQARLKELRRPAKELGGAL